MFIYFYLVGGVGHVGFGTFLRTVCVRQLYVKQVEDKTVQSWTQTVTEASDSCDHSLDNTCRHRDTHTGEVRKMSRRKLN